MSRKTKREKRSGVGKTDGRILSLFLFSVGLRKRECVRYREVRTHVVYKEHGIALLRITMRRRSRRSHDNDIALSWKRIFSQRAKYAAVVTVIISISRPDRRYDLERAMRFACNTLLGYNATRKHLRA